MQLSGTEIQVFLFQGQQCFFHIQWITWNAPGPLLDLVMFLWVTCTWATQDEVAISNLNQSILQMLTEKHCTCLTKQVIEMDCIQTYENELVTVYGQKPLNSIAQGLLLSKHIWDQARHTIFKLTNCTLQEETPVSIYEAPYFNQLLFRIFGWMGKYFEVIPIMTLRIVKKK